MKTCCRLLLSVLALSLLVMNSYAIRVPRDPNPRPIQVNNDEEIATSVKACKHSEDCSSTSSGNFRKLMNASPTTIPKSLEKAAINVSEDKEYNEINEMDYSPAKRKPPIHN